MMDQPETPDTNRDATPVNPVEAAMGMEARDMLRSITLPESGPIGQKDKDRVLGLAKAYLKQNRLPYSAVAKGIGASDSTVSEVMRGKYTRADDSDFIRSINRWMEDDERRRRSAKPIGLYETSVLTAIRDAAVIAKRNARVDADENTVHRERARIVMAIGPSGIGKTAGALALAGWDPNCFVVRIKESCGGSRALASQIILAAGWRPPSYGTNKVEFICGRLKDSGRLIVIDEAHRMMKSAFNLVRDISDVAGVPFLLLGTSIMQRRVDGPRMGLLSGVDDQFSRRVAYVVDLLRGSDGKGGKKRPFFSMEEIIAIFQADRIRITSDAFEFLQAIACTIHSGMLGQAENIFEKAVYSARRGNGIIDAKLLRLAAEKVLMAPGTFNEEILRLIDAQLETNRRLTGDTGRKAATA